MQFACEVCMNCGSRKILRNNGTYRERNEAHLVRRLSNKVALRAVAAHKNLHVVWARATNDGPATDLFRPVPDHRRVMTEGFDVLLREKLTVIILLFIGPVLNQLGYLLNSSSGSLLICSGTPEHPLLQMEDHWRSRNRPAYCIH
jgi:hypothetical protein